MLRTISDTPVDRVETPAERVRIAFELTDFCERMMRQRLRRERPSVSDETIEAEIDAWYGGRSEHGDGDGVLVPWPRP